MPNILKVLNPLFLDDLREQLEKAEDNIRKLRNLRKRLATIRVFDPACGSGNFLVIAYKEMREIEHEIVKRSGDEPKSKIPLANFYGIEIKDFAVEIARLSLLIAEFQCDERFIGQREARLNVLPLKKTGQIHTGNALRLDWLKVCPPAKLMEQAPPTDLFETEPEQPEIDFEAKDAETYICGNPPYYGSRKQEEDQKQDLNSVCSTSIKKWKSLDYVAGWMLLARKYMNFADAECAFVSTSSLCEGLQVSVLWPHVLKDGVEIRFAHQAFTWSNLATKNAAVIVVIVGLTGKSTLQKSLYIEDNQVWNVNSITPYLTPGTTVFIDTSPNPISALPRMVMGSMPRDGGNLILDVFEAKSLGASYPETKQFIRRYLGSEDLIKGLQRNCLWIEDSDRAVAERIPEIAVKFKAVKSMRVSSTLESTRVFADNPHRFVYLAGKSRTCTIAVSRVSSIRRLYPQPSPHFSRTTAD